MSDHNNKGRQQDVKALPRRVDERLNLSRHKEVKPSRLHDEVHRIVYELEARQLELEMQQENMLQSKEEMECLLKRYVEHYDIAPHSYMTISREGSILEANLTAAKNLGQDRALLKGDLLEKFIADKDRPVFKAFLERVFRGQTNAFCEVKLFNNQASQARGSAEADRYETVIEERMVRFDAALSNDGEECYIYITVSDRGSQNELEGQNTFFTDRLKDDIADMPDSDKVDFNYQLFDSVIHTRIRLAALSYLYTVKQARFVEIRDKIKASDGSLSVHMRMLESAGYISCDKEFLARKPQTVYRITPLGHDAFLKYSDIVFSLIAKKQEAS